MAGRAWRLAGVLALVALLAAPALPGAAGGRVLAHAQLVASSPGAGEILPDPPSELRLVFSERLEAQGTWLDLVDAAGEPILARAGEIDPDDPYALVVPTPELEDGTYSVSWRTLSADDGHPAEGFFSFGIGETVEAVPGVGSGGHGHDGAEPIVVATRLLTYPGLVLAIGVPIFHRAALRRGPMPAPLRRTLGAMLLVAAVASLLAALRNGVEAGGVVEYLFGTRNGLLLLGRAGVAAAGGAVLVGLGARDPRFAAPVAVATGLAGTLLLVLAGHASALPGLIGLAAQWAHVAAAAVWIGGVVALAAILLRPALIVGDGRRPPMREIVPRFSALALVSIAIVGMTGAYAAWRQVGAIPDPATDYGGTLLVKTAFAAGAMALGGLNYLDGGRMLGWLEGMRARVSLETIAIAAVLGGSALLAATPPRDEPAGVAIEPVPDAFGLVAPDMAMEIVPGRPGVNRAVVSTSEGLAAMSLSLSLDRLDATGSARVPLALPSDRATGDHEHDAPAEARSGRATWVAEALVLPPESQWDTAVRIQADADGPELSRQRFAFTMGDDGIVEGAAIVGLDPGLGLGIVLLVLGALGIGAGLGGARLPRTDPSASAPALVAAGLAAVAIGTGIGVERLLGV